MNFPNAMTDAVVVFGDSDGTTQTAVAGGGEIESAVWENDNSQGGVLYGSIKNGATPPTTAAKITLQRRAKGRVKWGDLYVWSGTLVINDLVEIGDLWLSGRFEFKALLTSPVGQDVEVELVFVPGAS